MASMRRPYIIVGILAIAIAICVGLAFRENSTIDERSADRQLVHDALQAHIDKNHTKSCQLYREIIAKRITIDAYETSYLEDSCAKTRD